jgi:hypothetical protein
MLTSVVILIAEPEVVKTMLSTKFDDFALPARRIDLIVPSLGHGISASNSAAWERSRALIRHNFTRNQVADLDTFERHRAFYMRYFSWWFHSRPPAVVLLIDY